MSRVKVDAPVTADFARSRINATLAPPRHLHIPPDNGRDLPWVWLVSVHIRFHLGQAQVSKMVRARFPYPPDYDKFKVLDPLDAQAGLDSALTDLRRLVARHGVELPPSVPVQIHDYIHRDEGPF